MKLPNIFSFFSTLFGGGHKNKNNQAANGTDNSAPLPLSFNGPSHEKTSSTLNNSRPEAAITSLGSTPARPIQSASVSHDSELPVAAALSSAHSAGAAPVTSQTAATLSHGGGNPNSSYSGFPSAGGTYAGFPSSYSGFPSGSGSYEGFPGSGGSYAGFPSSYSGFPTSGGSYAGFPATTSYGGFPATNPTPTYAGFPTTNTSDPTSTSQVAAVVVSSPNDGTTQTTTPSGADSGGWASTPDAKDPVAGVFEAPTTPSTDPLKIKTDKS